MTAGTLLFFAAEWKHVTQHIPFYGHKYDCDNNDKRPYNRRFKKGDDYTPYFQVKI